jgi:outer membrane beta-barrel protein
MWQARTAAPSHTVGPAHVDTAPSGGPASGGGASSPRHPASATSATASCATVDVRCCATCGVTGDTAVASRTDISNTSLEPKDRTFSTAKPKKRAGTHLANVVSKGLRLPSLLRATFVFAIAIPLGLGLGNETRAEAAPAADVAAANPFQPAAGDDDDADETAPAAGETPEDEDEGPGADSALHALTCLDSDATGGRRKGVQRRDFLKRHRFELSGVGGFYASDALSSTYTYGGALSFYPSEDFGLEALVTRSPVQFRLEEPFNSFTKEEHFVSGNAWQAILSMLWSPIHAKFKFTEQTIVHGDVFVAAGAGRTFHESVMGLTWEAGGGFKLYLARYVAFRFDVRDYLLPQEVLGRGRITNNITALGGFSVWVL